MLRIFKKAGIVWGLDTGPAAMVAEKCRPEAEELRLGHPSPPPNGQIPSPQPTKSSDTAPDWAERWLAHAETIALRQNQARVPTKLHPPSKLRSIRSSPPGNTEIPEERSHRSAFWEM